MYSEIPKALILLVHYKTPDGVLALLDSLQDMQRRSEVAITVVDSCSGEEYLSGIRDRLGEFQNVELLESPTNRGYFGAARFALDYFLAQGHDLPDWVIVCNHDVVIEDKDFFLKLFSQDSSGIAVIAPRIQILPGRVDQNPFMRRRPGKLRWVGFRLSFSTYGIAALWDWLSRWRQALRSRWQTRLSKTGSIRNGGPEVIYAPHGAFFIFSRRYFEAGGYLDGKLFLYGEEISVAEICRSLRLPVVYEPSLGVLHKEHASTGKRINRFSYECQKNALRYVTSRYLSG